jgi:hypothetical protein
LVGAVSMKKGDLVKFKNTIGVSGNVFLIVRTGEHYGNYAMSQKVWIYPRVNADADYDHNDDDNYYFAHYFEVLNESR